ncbi:MAG TPA: serine hydrolase domain-containing protein [Ilumatobacter sp.]|nr:serine hydrolase domain-containing protein [Ilumatobacter sp.]
MTLPTGDPAQHGFDPARLARLDAHFRRYVDAGQLPGFQVLVARHGELVHAASAGWRDAERAVAWGDDPIVRLFSMTKPITSVAAMMLYEEGAFELKDPVSRFIPSFAEARVYREGSTQKPLTDPVVEPLRIWHLLTHTSGLTYGFHHQHVTDALYRNAGFEWGSPAGLDLAGCCDAWAGLPLAFQPGSEWLYGYSTDVLGRVVEVVSGMPLDEFFRTRIFEPLGVHETWFRVPEAVRDRCTGLWLAGPDGLAHASPIDLNSPDGMPWLSGGGGLWGTASDYLEFASMLLRRGDGLLGSRTVDYMTRNHLPGNADLEAFGRPLFAETTFDGVGFGLGFSVLLDPAGNKTLSSAGDYSWGGAASTFFWNDPTEQISVVFLTQLVPSSALPIRPQLRQLVNQALID